MEVNLIKSEKDYQNAFKRLDEIFHAESGTKEQEELEILVLLIEKYELETEGEFPAPDPIEAIKFRMEQMGLTQKDLSEIIGLKSRTSEILSRRRSMSLNIIRKISKELLIPADVLIQSYKTV